MTHHARSSPPSYRDALFVLDVVLTASGERADLLRLASVFHRRNIDLIKAEFSVRRFRATFAARAAAAETLRRSMENLVDVFEATLHEIASPALGIDEPSPSPPEPVDRGPQTAPRTTTPRAFRSASPELPDAERPVAMTRRASFSQDAPEPVGPYSPAIRQGNLVFASGQGGFTPSGKLLPGLRDQTKQTLDNLLAVLASAGASELDVVRVGVFLTEFSNFEEMNNVYSTYFSEPWPARTTVYVGLPPGMLVEIDAVATI